MKKILLALYAVFLLTGAFGQSENQTNPVLSSTQISEEKPDGFELTANYYTIENNISDKASSAYVSDQPALTEYVQFARDIPSYYFIVHHGQKTMLTITLEQKNEGSNTVFFYHIVRADNGKSTQSPCRVYGEISEKRAEELLKLKVDPAARITDLPNGGKGFSINGSTYAIQPYERLKAEVIETASQQLNAEEEIKDSVQYIRNETIGGKLDFNKMLEGNTQSMFVYDGIAYSKKDFAIYLWGKKVQMLGVGTSANAIRLWEEIHVRELTEPEKKALKAGFESNNK